MKVVQRVQQFTAKNKTASVLINSKYMQQFKKCSVNSVVLLDTCDKFSCHTCSVLYFSRHVMTFCVFQLKL